MVRAARGATRSTEERGGATHTLLTHIEIKWEEALKKTPQRPQFTVQKSGRKVSPGLSSAAACYFTPGQIGCLCRSVTACWWWWWWWWWDGHIRGSSFSCFWKAHKQKKCLCWDPSRGECRVMGSHLLAESRALLLVCWQFALQLKHHVWAGRLEHPAYTRAGETVLCG